MPEDTRTPSQRAHDDASRETFGANPLRNPDGTPMETGHGSAFAAMSPAAKAHFHITAALAATENIGALAKQLADAVARLAPLNDAALKASQSARAEEQKAAVAAAQAGSDEPEPPAPKPASPQAAVPPFGPSPTPTPTPGPAQAN